MDGGGGYGCGGGVLCHYYVNILDFFTSTNLQLRSILGHYLVYVESIILLATKLPK